MPHKPGRVTASGRPPLDGEDVPAPDMSVKPGGQHGDYWILDKAERAKGFIRPVRRSYVHDRCGTTTHMGLSIAETYARDPHFYGSTFCVMCGSHFPVGADGEFSWAGTDIKVGT